MLGCCESLVLKILKGNKYENYRGMHVTTFCFWNPFLYLQEPALWDGRIRPCTVSSVPLDLQYNCLEIVHSSLFYSSTWFHLKLWIPEQLVFNAFFSNFSSKVEIWKHAVTYFMFVPSTIPVFSILFYHFKTSLQGANTEICCSVNTFSRFLFLYQYKWDTDFHTLYFWLALNYCNS